MFKKEIQKINNFIIENNTYCTRIQIKQRWRGLIRIEVEHTSGTINSDVWSTPEKFWTTPEQLNEELTMELISPYGGRIHYH